MPLVEIHKAKKRRAIKRRPEWQDTRPPEEELRAGYDIAARHVGRFSRAYMAMTRELLTPAVNKKILASLRNGNVDGAVRAVPTFKKTDPEGQKVWADLSRKMKNAFEDVITEAGENEFKREKLPFTFKITKDSRVPVVPINPWSLKWIEKESSNLIKEVSVETQKVIRQIIRRGFARGLRDDAILAQIKDRVGLLQREELAVQRRLDLMLSQGIPSGKANKKSAVYAAQLLTKRAKRIARSETITAQAKGRSDAWAMAKQRGELQGAVREWLAVTVSVKTCKICHGLDGQQVEIGEDYYSDVLGRKVSGPGIPAHPSCRCQEALRRKKAAK